MLSIKDLIKNHYEKHREENPSDTEDELLDVLIEICYMAVLAEHNSQIGNFDL
jgi:NTP pyrophosphatase (non-canonical NTP hydrolase)